MQEVKIIEDSISPAGVRITTFQLKYWRAIHGEFMTHRVFSRNASSSRAIPVKKSLSQLWNEPATPVEWGRNMSGMQAKELLTGWRLWAAKKIWNLSAKFAAVVSWSLMKLDVHKQIANRAGEPYNYISVVVTATEWDNFFALRDHPDAQPEIRELAKQMKFEYLLSKPVELKEGQWHLPYVKPTERLNYPIEDLIKFSAARCARVSYLTHDAKTPTPEKDIELFDRLVGSEPMHASPIEHAAMATNLKEIFFGNFRGWNQYRKQFELERK